MPPLRRLTRKAVRMAFREVPVFEVREMLRLWLLGADAEIGALVPCVLQRPRCPKMPGL